MHFLYWIQIWQWNIWISIFFESCKNLSWRLHWTSTWRGVIFQCWWNAAICWFIVTIHYYLMWNDMQLYEVNISLYHLVLHFLSLQDKRTALHLASISGHDKVCQVLLQAGADVQAVIHHIVSTIIFDAFHTAYCSKMKNFIHVL